MMYVPAGGTTYQSFMNAKQLMDISEYLDEYGQDITAALGDQMLGTQKGDGIYGATNNYSKAEQETILMRKDILDQLNLTEKAENASSWSDIAEIYKEVAANTDLAPVINSDQEGTVANPRPYSNGSDSFADCYSFDNLGDGNLLIRVNEEIDTVESYYASEEYRKTCERMRQWYEEGLIYKDSTTSQDYADTLIKNNIGFSRVSMTEIGSVESAEAMFHYYTTKLLFRWMNRRSQKKSYNWEEFKQMQNYYPLAYPKSYFHL